MATAKTLKRMKRPANVEWVYRTINQLREMMPQLAIRTTFIVGYPGETETEFEALLDMMRQLEFDRVGAFQYSFEPGTPSATLPNQVDDAIKQERYERLMSLQQGISLKKKPGVGGQGRWTSWSKAMAAAKMTMANQRTQLSAWGRSYRDAPEIDGYVLVEGELPIGEIVPARITGATTYDLLATVEREAPLVIQPGAIYGEGMLEIN